MGNISGTEQPEGSEGLQRGRTAPEALEQNQVHLQVLPSACGKVVWSVSKSPINSNPVEEPPTFCIEDM